MMKMWQKFILFVLLIGIYFVPIVLILGLSKQEVKKYEVDMDFNISESKVYDTASVQRMDISEYYNVNVKVTCINKKTKTIASSSEVLKEAGDEFLSNTVVANQAGTQITLDCNGIIDEIEYGDSIKIIYYDFSDLVYECYIPEEYTYAFDEDAVYTSDGEKLAILFKSNINRDDKYLYYIEASSADSFNYGKSVNEYSLYTGTVFSGVLVLDKRCIFYENNEPYVKVVDENGIPSGESKVELGFESVDQICVTGLEEGTICEINSKPQNNSEGNNSIENDDFGGNWDESSY